MAMDLSQELDRASQLHQSGRLAEAEAIYRNVLAVDPLNARAIQFMGILHFQAGNFPAAIELVRRAIDLQPNAADFHSNLGVILSEAGHYEAAVPHYEQSIALNPGDPDVHWNFAINLLACGQFPRGWEEFEWRLHSPSKKLNRGFRQPQWDGSSFISRTLLLHTEGGFGDAIQFIRYLPLVAARGGTVVLECQPELVDLFRPLQGVCRIVARGETLPTFDAQIPLQSLPKVFGTKLATIPANIPYLFAPPATIGYWKNRMAGRPRPKIGIAWAGSNTTSGKRSRTLGIFAPLAAITGVQFFSLQKGPEADQPPPAGLHLYNYTNELHDFAQLAAFILALDLVITVDTSVAHLAGAIGKPVWTLLPFHPDFRWLRDRPDSPWYPTMRLFRQKQREPWVEVVHRMAHALTSPQQPGDGTS